MKKKEKVSNGIYFSLSHKNKKISSIPNFYFSSIERSSLDTVQKKNLAEEDTSLTAYECRGKDEGEKVSAHICNDHHGY